MINLDNYRSGYAKKHYVYNEVENAKVTDFVNYYSQNGEDGVLEKIFETLDIQKGTFVNAGCDDIHDHSNVRRLVSTHGWNGLFIEPNEEMLFQGKLNLQQDERIKDWDFKFHNSFLSVNDDDESITNILGDYYNGETQFDLLTLHIDSFEYWVLEDFLSGHYDAKVILVGYNFSQTESVSAPKDCSPKIGHKSITDNFFSASAPALNKLARKYGFELVSICKPNNLIFINQYYNEGRFKVYEPLNIDDFYWEGDNFTNRKRQNITDGWVSI
tara:strand:+ start:19260 stop:20075 length:816 start_codon:yes stop_codon:yes gene_type:complete